MDWTEKSVINSCIPDLTKKSRESLIPDYQITSPWTSAGFLEWTDSQHHRPGSPGCRAGAACVQSCRDLNACTILELRFVRLLKCCMGKFTPKIVGSVWAAGFVSVTSSANCSRRIFMMATSDLSSYQPAPQHTSPCQHTWDMLRTPETMTHVSSGSPLSGRTTSCPKLVSPWEKTRICKCLLVASLLDCTSPERLLLHNCGCCHFELLCRLPNKQLMNYH